MARLLFEDGHGPAGVFRVEDQRPAPLLGQQGGQLVARPERQAQDGEHHRRRAAAHADAPVAALQHCDRTEQRTRDGQASERAGEPKPRYENEAGEERARDPTGGVQREGPPDVPADAVRVRDQPGGSREGRAEERRGHEQHHSCGHRKARRDLDRLASRRAHRPHPGESLGVG